MLLCVNQPSSGAARRLRARQPSMEVWWGTTIEVRSALVRVQREQLFDAGQFHESLDRLAVIHAASLELQPSELVRSLASQALERFDLRAADALQLAAALVLCREHPRGRSFVCYDRRLSTAASLAGFTLLP